MDIRSLLVADVQSVVVGETRAGTFIETNQRGVFLMLAYGGSPARRRKSLNRGSERIGANHGSVLKYMVGSASAKS